MPPTFRFLLLGVLLPTFAVSLPSSQAADRADATEAISWFDTLGYPDARDLAYVRVATGLSWQRGNAPGQNRFEEGFLLSEDAGAFTVFLCSVADFADRGGFSEPHPALTTVHFVRVADGPAYKRVGYEVLDFKKASAAALERVRKQFPKDDGALQFGRLLSHRARIFAFGRACLQKGLSDTGFALLDFAARIPGRNGGKAEPRTLRAKLQEDIGDFVLLQAEEDCGNPEIPWVEILKKYENFDQRFPANLKLDYAGEAAVVLRKMIAEDAAHQAKPLDQMSPAEQAAENIYQLQNFRLGYWVRDSRYPDVTPTGEKLLTSVDQLVDLGQEAVPQLIAALDDRRFTRSMRPSFNGMDRPQVLRVADIAQRILEFESGQNFYARRTDDGTLVHGTTRQQAEAWWAEVKDNGEKLVLIKSASAGGQEGCAAARKLAEKYPDAAVGAIERGFRATKEEGTRGEYVEVAGLLPGDAPLAFLKSKLAAGTGLYSQVHAAEALQARGKPEAIPAMMKAWDAVQPRLPKNESDAYGEVGGLITFLAKSGDADAIKALARNLRKAPVDVRLAVVRVFLPPSKNAGMGGSGVSVHTAADFLKMPAGDAGAAIECLLVAALDDTARRVGMKGYFDDASYEDPRICDLAALVLSRQWPDKYHFQWSANAAECDGEIEKIRHQSRP